MNLKDKLTQERHELYLERLNPIADQIRAEVEKAVRNHVSHLKIKIRLAFASADEAILFINGVDYHTFDLTTLIGTQDEIMESLLNTLSPDGFEDKTVTYQDQRGGDSSGYQIGFDINPVY